MMVPVDDDEDDFIVQTVEDTAVAASDTQQDESWRQYGMKKLGGLVFSSRAAAEMPVEPEPTLPAGFSATLNAEEEEIYPAEVRITVSPGPGPATKTHTHRETEKEAARCSSFSAYLFSCAAECTANESERTACGCACHLTNRYRHL